MKVGGACLGSVALKPQLLRGATSQTNAPTALPSSAQVAWQDCEIGLIYHFDMAIAAGNFAPNNTHRQRFDPTSAEGREQIRAASIGSKRIAKGRAGSDHECRQ